MTVRRQPESELEFRQFHDLLYQSYGPQHWWPADSAFEVMVGAVLTQNTAWGNVEKAIDRLQVKQCLNPEALLQMPESELAGLIRPAGYFNVKAGRLRNLCAWVVQSGGVEALAEVDTSVLRRRLLAVKGVGPETADDILLYAFERAVFVVDAYTRRIGERVGLLRGDADYESVRAAFEQALGLNAGLFNELHALIVKHAKQHCRKKPVCRGCPLADVCPSEKLDV